MEISASSRGQVSDFSSNLSSYEKANAAVVRVAESTFAFCNLSLMSFTRLIKVPIAKDVSDEILPQWQIFAASNQVTKLVSHFHALMKISYIVLLLYILDISL